MRKQRLYGPMGKWIKQHLDLRHSLGFIYKKDMYYLDQFDQYLAKHYSDCTTITRDMIVGYLETTISLAPSSRHDHVTCLRQFCRFMFQFDIDTYIPEKGLIEPKHVQIKVHIFTEEEILKIIQQANNLKGQKGLLSKTYATIIGLLWVTGMRIGEIVNLKVEDVDTDTGIIYIRQTKFFKSRLIPLSTSSVWTLKNYKQERRNCGYSENPGTHFFYSKRGTHCITHTVSGTIKELMIRAGIKTLQGKVPRVHDIRHSFATRWILDFYQSGKDPMKYLAVLATYMGHANITNTQVYLHPSTDLLSIAGNQLQTYILGKNNETDK